MVFCHAFRSVNSTAEGLAKEVVDRYSPGVAHALLLLVLVVWVGWV